jgi:flagellar motor switch protein FliN/FliY
MAEDSTQPAPDESQTPQPEQQANDPAAEAMLAAARAAIGQINDMSSEVEEAVATGSASTQDANTKSLQLPDFSAMLSPAQVHALDLLSDVHLNVKIELGRTRMLVEDVLRLNEGAVVELDKLAGDPVDVFVNERHVARGEVLVLNDNFCVRINEILEPQTEGAHTEDKGAA